MLYMVYNVVDWGQLTGKRRGVCNSRLSGDIRIPLTPLENMMAKLPKTTKIIVKSGKGRDSSKGLLAFKTGIIKPKRQRSKIRGDKYHDRELRQEIDDS